MGQTISNTPKIKRLRCWACKHHHRGSVEITSTGWMRLRAIAQQWTPATIRAGTYQPEAVRILYRLIPLKDKHIDRGIWVCPTCSNVIKSSYFLSKLKEEIEGSHEK